MRTYGNAVGTASSEEEESRRLLQFETAVPRHPVLDLPDEEANARRAAPRRACNWVRLLFLPPSVPLSAAERHAEAAYLHDQKVLRCSVSLSEHRAMNHKTVLQCLEWYNSTHQSNVRRERPKPREPPCTICKGTGAIDCRICFGRGRVNHVNLVILPKGEWP